MADERDLSNKIADGLWGVTKAVGSKIGDAASSLGGQAVDFYNMSPEDQATALATGNGEAIMQKQQNAQDVSNLLNAQNPAPQLNTVTAQSPVDQLILNNAAMSGEASQSLSPAEATGVLSGVQAMQPSLNDQGNANQIAAPPQPAAAPVTAEQISSGGPGLSNPMNAAFGTQALGINQAAAAGQMKAVAENEFYKKSGELAKEAQDKTEALGNAFNLQYQEKMDDLTTAMKEYKELAGQKVVPAAFLARQDTSGALSTGISVALGAMAGALNGTNQNIGLEMINKAIDRDVAAQQYNLEQATRIKGNDISNQNSLLAKMKDKFTDDKSAILATKAVMTSMAMDKMNEKLTSKGGARDMGVQSQANMARAQLLEKKIGYEMQLKAAQESQFAKQEAMKNVNYYDMSNEQALQQFGKDADKYVRGYGMATDPQLAKDFIQKVKPMGDTIRKLKSTMSSIDNLSMFNPSDRGALEAIMTDLQLTLKDEENYKLGVLTGPDMELLQKVTGDPTSFNAITNLSTKSRLKQALKNVQEKMNNKVKNYGFELDKGPNAGVSNLVKPVK